MNHCQILRGSTRPSSKTMMTTCPHPAKRSQSRRERLVLTYEPQPSILRTLFATRAVTLLDRSMTNMSIPRHLRRPHPAASTQRWHQQREVEATAPQAFTAQHQQRQVPATAPQAFTVPLRSRSAVRALLVVSVSMSNKSPRPMPRPCTMGTALKRWLHESMLWPRALPADRPSLFPMIPLRTQDMSTMSLSAIHLCHQSQTAKLSCKEPCPLRLRAPIRLVIMQVDSMPLPFRHPCRDAVLVATHQAVVIKGLLAAFRHCSRSLRVLAAHCLRSSL